MQAEREETGGFARWEPDGRSEIGKQWLACRDVDAWLSVVGRKRGRAKDSTDYGTLSDRDSDVAM